MARSFGADEEPVLYPELGRADGILNEVVVDLDGPVAKVEFQSVPLLYGIGDGLAHIALGQVAGAEFEERLLDPAQDGSPC